MSLAVPNELNKVDLSLNSSASFNDIRLPHALTSSTQRLGIDIDPSSQQVEPLIAQLNERGLKSIADNDYNQALLYFQEGQNLLQLVAGCGKSIDRQLILTILTNQAYVFQEEGKLDLAKRYIEAVIYNINVYLQHSAQLSLLLQLQKYLEGSKNHQQAEAFRKQHQSGLSTLINRTQQLSVAQLQYASLLAENYENVAAAVMAEKSISSMYSHLKYSRIYSHKNSQPGFLDREVIEKDIIQEELVQNNIQFECLQRQVTIMIDKHCQRQQLTQLWSHTVKLGDFLKLKPQPYTRMNSALTSAKVQTENTQRCLIEKYLHVGCGYLLVGASKMKEWNQTQYLIGTTSQYEEQRQIQLKEAEISYLLSLKIILKYLPKGSILSSEAIEAYNSRMNQEYKIRVIEAVHQKCNPQSNTKNKTSSQSEIDSNSEDFKRTDKLMPPSVDPFMMDLSSADSIDLHSNASMIDVLREADLGSKTDEDQQLYFQFMPKKTTNSNPLFQATGNLLELKKQSGLKRSKRDRTLQVSLQKMVQESCYEVVKKIEIKAKPLKVRYLQPKSKGSSKEKWPKPKSKAKYLSPQFQIHSVSTQEITIKKQRSKSKSKSKAKNPEIISNRVLALNFKPEHHSKQQSKNQSKMTSQRIIKINKIKSPPPKPKKIAQPIASQSKNARLNTRQRSQQKSIKPAKSKSKSISQKGLKQKKCQEKRENVYLIKNK